MGRLLVFRVQFVVALVALDLDLVVGLRAFGGLTFYFYPVLHRVRRRGIVHESDDPRIWYMQQERTSVQTSPGGWLDRPTTHPYRDVPLWHLRFLFLPPYLCDAQPRPFGLSRDFYPPYNTTLMEFGRSA